MMMLMMMMMMLMMVMMMLIMMMMMIQMNIFHDFSTPYEVKQVAFDLNRSSLFINTVSGRKKTGLTIVYIIYFVLLFLAL